MSPHPLRLPGADATFVLLALALCGSVGLIAASPAAMARPGVLHPAATLDLVLGLPLLGYLCLVRTGRVRWTALIPLALLGILVSGPLIPGPARLPMDLLEPALLLGEGLLLVVLVSRVRRIRRRYLDLRGDSVHAADAMRVSLREVMGSFLGGAVFSEAAVLWYGVTGWWRRTPPPTEPDHPGSRGQGAMVGALSLVIAVETVAVHLVVGLWDVRIAWVLTALSVYSVLWLFGDLHAGRFNPTRVDATGLHLRSGLRWHLDVNWDEVAGIRTTCPDGPVVSLTFLRGPDLWIEFRAPQLAHGVLGIRTRTRCVGVGLDDSEAFRAAAAEFLAEPGPTRSPGSAPRR